MKQCLQTYLSKLVHLRLLLIVIFLGCTTASFAQDSKGTEFWICFPGNEASPDPLLFITGEAASTVTITIPGLGFSQTVNVPAGGLQTIDLPGAAQIQSQFIAEKKGIHITATTPVTVYGMNAQTATTDAYLAFPVDAIGKEYYVMAYNKDFSFAIPTQATFLATQNNTTITITSSLTDGSFTAGVPKSVVLQQGEVYQLRSLIDNADYTGTKVTADKPISVFGGAQCTNISGLLRACDHLVEQLPPLNTWGKSFLTVPLATRLAGDVFRFMAQTDGTIVKVNGTTVATLNAGHFFETILSSTSYNHVTSNLPILVGQYSRSSQADNITSDPFFSLVPPDEQFLNSYTISAGTPNIPSNFLNITSPTSNIGTVKVDGAVVNAGLWHNITGTTFSGSTVPVTAGVHTIISSLPIGLLVYGYGSFDSYGYLGGQSFSPVATVNTVTFAPKTGTASVGTNECFTATVKDQFNVPVVGVRVDFNITGANPGSSSFSNTNANGIAQFCYAGANTGSDSITAAVGTVTDGGRFNWTAKTNTADYYSKPAGELQNTATWGVNPDGSGANPPDFTAGKTFHLVNRVPLYTMTANWTVGGKLDIPAGSTLSINGNTLSIADLIGTGNFSGSLSSNLTVMGVAGGDAALKFASGAGNLNNLTLNRTGTAPTATVGTALNIYGVLTLTSGTLNTGNFITLKSNISSTARVAPVTGAISGNVTVERYVPARRAWRIMSAPVWGSQTINAAWQEGATTSSAVPNPHPGFGTHITEGSAAQGFDHNPLIAMTSVQKYVSSVDDWVPLTNTNATAVNADAYMLFVRGDRSIALGLNTVAPNITTLRATGPLKTGNQTFPVAASGFTGIPNPFASPINFATLTRNNVQNNFYLWDPKLGGGAGVGGYVLLSFNGTGYDITPAPVSPESQLIQSGQGFLVQSTGVAGSIVIKESDKSATAATNVFRTINDASASGVAPTAELMVTDNATKGLRTTLLAVNDDKTTAVIDEALSSYGAAFSNKVDDMDALKPANINENLGIIRDGKTLMIERRQGNVGKNDTINLRLWNTAQKDYMLQFTPANLSSASIQSAYLEDRYLHTTTAVSLSKVTTVAFAVNASKASADANRFIVVLVPSNKGVVNALNDKAGIRLSPNPITGNTVNVQFVDQPAGTYNLALVNTIGQVVFEGQVKHPGGSATQTVQLGGAMAKGVYRMRVTNPTANITFALPVVVLSK